MKLQPVPVPPHFQYFCGGCNWDYSTTERAAFANPRRDAFQTYMCARCASAENRRQA